MINRKIFSIWLSEDPIMPEMIEKCIESQKEYCRKHNFEYELITLQTCYKGSKYIQECLNSPHRAGIKYCKASDYLRFYYLKEGYGIYLDADVLVPENSAGFESLLNEQMFVGEEGCETIPGTIVLGTAVMGSIVGHPLFEKLLQVIESEFSGSDALNYQSSMDLLNVHGVDYQHIMTICEPSMFYPYRHRDESWNITKNTVCVHLFNRSWISLPKGDLPTVSIIIPSLGDTERRKTGLQKCLDSIEQLNYPRHLIDIHIIEGQETVPEKVKKGVENSKGEFVCYLANDTVIEKECLLNAINASKKYDVALVSFNEGHLLSDFGNCCTHFIIRRDYIKELDNNEVFCCEMKHCGVDNYLWAQCHMKDEAYWCEECRIEHDHFSKTGVSDVTYEKGWQYLAEDREVLKQKLYYLYGEGRIW